MLKIRKSEDRGLTKIDWLTSYHSFSFGDYIDLAHRGFGNLRVINQDVIAPNSGFGTHPHWNMEIVTYVYEGTLEHQDSMGNRFHINAGDVQRMSAGTGIEHSEYNASKDTPVKLLQIWVLPASKGGEPGYEQKHFASKEKLQLIASADGRNNSLTINQQMDIEILRLQAGENYSYTISGNRAWIQVVQGNLNLDDKELNAGDGSGIENENELKFSAISDLELLIFDMG